MSTRLPTFLLCMVVTSACVSAADGGVAAPPVVPRPTSTTTALPAVTTSLATPTPSTTAEVGPPTGPALALVTDTGVVVPVTAETPAGYVITTPCGEAGYTSGGEAIYQVDAVLDPGHGGPVDTGAVGRNGLQEKHLNLDVARLAQSLLEERGIATLLTRTADYAVPLSVRALIADAVDAQLLVSIHHNAPTPGESPTPGTEIFIQSQRSDSRRLGGLLYEHVFEALATIPGVNWHAAPDAGVLIVRSTRGRDAYGMIRLPGTVSALAELAYISSPQEAEFLATEQYLELAGRALADAIEEYLTTDEPGRGFVAEPRVFNPQPSVPASMCVEVPLD